MRFTPKTDTGSSSASARTRLDACWAHRRQDGALPVTRGLAGAVWVTWSGRTSG
jgi:hypothetical protein